jgi:hypothetical protein
LWRRIESAPPIVSADPGAMFVGRGLVRLRADSTMAPETVAYVRMGLLALGPPMSGLLLEFGVMLALAPRSSG